MLVNHITATTEQLPPIKDGYLYEYVLAGNGLFIRTRRREFEVSLPVHSFTVTGLFPVQSYVRLFHGRIPVYLTQAISNIFKRDMPFESLMWIDWNKNKYRATRPVQKASPGHVYPVDAKHPIGAKAFLDIHSHGAGFPFFSSQDDSDETGLRIYAVIGTLDKVAHINVRLGIYGRRWNINPACIFELPSGLIPCTER